MRTVISSISPAYQGTKMEWLWSESPHITLVITGGEGGEQIMGAKFPCWCNALINVKPAVGRQGMGWRFDCFKNLLSNSLPTGKSFQSNVTKFPHPGLHIATKYSKAEPKKGTMKISPNKTLQSSFINIAASPKIHVPVTAAIIRFNYNPCYTA